MMLLCVCVYVYVVIFKDSKMATGLCIVVSFTIAFFPSLCLVQVREVCELIDSCLTFVSLFH